jgi:hypothetical protein
MKIDAMIDKMPGVTWMDETTSENADLFIYATTSDAIMRAGAVKIVENVERRTGKSAGIPTGEMTSGENVGIQTCVMTGAGNGDGKRTTVTTTSGAKSDGKVHQPRERLV